VKKISAILGVCAALAISALPAFASTYNPTYSPTHGTITEVSGTINNGFSGCARAATLSVQINGTTATSTGVNFSNNCDGTPTFDITGLSIAITDSDVVSLNVSPDGNGNYTVTSATITVAAGGSGGSSNPVDNNNNMGITVATGTAALWLADAAATVSNAGVLEVVGLAVGIPLAFYILHQLIGLIPKGKAGRRN